MTSRTLILCVLLAGNAFSTQDDHDAPKATPRVRTEHDSSIVNGDALKAKAGGLSRHELKTCGGPSYPVRKGQKSLMYALIDGICELVIFDESGRFSGVVETNILGAKGFEGFTIIPGDLLGFPAELKFTYFRGASPKEAGIMLPGGCAVQRQEFQLVIRNDQDSGAVEIKKQKPEKMSLSAMDV